MANGVLGLALGATALGLMHGLAPGHGWAIAASYALNKPNKWLYAAASSLILGIGHLISSILMVLVYFWTLSYFGLTQIGWMNYVAGTLLIGLGIWQYFNGHNHSAPPHGSEDAYDSEPTSSKHGPDPSHDQERWTTRLRRSLPVRGNLEHTHTHHPVDEESDRDLYGMVALAFALGFTHNEEFDIIAICTGSAYCLELMLLYSLAVIVSLVGITLLLVASYERYEDRLEGYTDSLPTFTAAILIIMGIGFILGVF